MKRKILDIQVDKLLNIGTFHIEYQNLLQYTQGLAEMMSGTRRPQTSGMVTGRRRNIPLVKVPNEGDRSNRITINQSPSTTFNGNDSPPIKVELG